MESLMVATEAKLAHETPSPPMRRIVLTGFMGAGKSTAGRLLAAELGWQFIDTDTEIEGRYTQTVAEMFSTHGEPVFRRRESAAIARALGQDHVVVALGGGAVESLTNRLLLEQTSETAVILLDAPFEDLFDRCVLQEGTSVRPVLVNAERAAERYRLRLPLYRRCARLYVDTSRQTARETVLSILRALQMR